MHLALHTTFACSRREPLVEVVLRIHAAILAAGLREPSIQFILADSPLEGGVSSVARVLKRFPQLEPFVLVNDVNPSPISPIRVQLKVITNRADAGTSSDQVDFATILEIARGVPRSFPFHNVGLHFSVPAFSFGAMGPTIQGGLAPGIDVRDSWWANGRQRSLTALAIVDADPSSKKLPALPEAIASVYSACGKVKKTIQAPLVIGPVAQRPSLDTASPQIAQAIRAMVQDYRTRMSEVLDLANPPHDLPPNPEAYADAAALAATAGPKKPELVRVFTPMGYDCRGESGNFTLRRRTPENLTAELVLDVGSWSNQVAGFFRVQGLVNDLGFKATLIMPVSRRAVLGSQYAIGSQDQWRQIVENLAAIVAELDRSFVPAIEAIAGPSPDWYQPESSPNARD
jgi:hypothetical protein